MILKFMTPGYESVHDITLSTGPSDENTLRELTKIAVMQYAGPHFWEMLQKTGDKNFKVYEHNVHNTFEDFKDVRVSVQTPGITLDFVMRLPPDHDIYKSAGWGKKVWDDIVTNRRYELRVDYDFFNACVIFFLTIPLKYDTIQIYGETRW